MNSRLRDIIITALVAVLLFSSVNMSYDLIKAKEEKDANAELRQLMEQAAAAPEETPALPEVKEEDPPVEVEEEKPEETPEPTPTPEPEILPQYEALYEMNNDMAGWLSIEGTEIDYPVMYTPEDQNYYLHIAFDGSEAYSGSLFIGIYWDDSTNHTLIHGHNMKNGTMFGTLQYYSLPDYAAQHPTISFDTLYEKHEYTVIGAFFTHLFDDDSDEEGFRYYYYTDLSNEDTYNWYIEQVKEESLYETDVEVEYGMKVLTLSTCSYHVKDGRFVVVAVETNENS